MDPLPAAWFAQLRGRLRERRHRGLVVVSGPAGWGRDTAAALAARVAGERLWVGDECPVPTLNQCSGADARQWLGRNLELIVWDSHAGTHPSGLGAVSGALVGGGVLLWLVPPLAQWHQGTDPDYERLRCHAPPYRFLKRMARILETAAAEPLHTLVTPETQRLSLPEETSVPASAPDGPTAGQNAAVMAILSLATQTHPAPVVLRADRGRGKSAAMGMAAARLVREQGLRVGVTAARSSVLGAFWAFVPPDCRAGIYFDAPDELLCWRPPMDLLLVDEAAMLPAPMLSALVARWPRAALATTVHGYEGTGRGFDLRFRDHLARDHPGWRELELKEPIRWAPHDPLESVIHRILCLDADPAPVSEPGGRYECEKLDRDELLANEPLLSQLMGLLVSAHYQTSPDDLRQILDDPESAVWVARRGGSLIGAAWILREGGLDRALAESVSLGRRRPRGHLLAQSLAFQGANPEAALLHYTRVTRIAVHPNWRRRGLGLELLARIEAQARAAGVDVLGVSFGVTPGLLDFWEAAGFGLLRLGTRRDAASGTHAAMLGKPLSPSGSRLYDEHSERFARHWPWLGCFFDNLEPGLKARLEAMLPCPRQPASLELDEADLRELQSFASGHRELALTRLPLARLHRLTANQAGCWKEVDQRLWQRAVVDGMGWEQLRRERRCTSRREGLQRLRVLAGERLAAVYHDGL